jgi:hypothetical protein
MDDIRQQILRSAQGAALLDMLPCDRLWDMEWDMGRAHVVMADDVLEAIDQLVGERGRSRFLEEAAREKLERLELEKALHATAGIARGEKYGHWQDRKTTAAWIRGQRESQTKRRRS